MPQFGGATGGVPNVPRSMPAVRGFVDGNSPVLERAYQLQGVSRDATGAALGGCTCTLFRVDGTDFWQEQRMVSDAVTGVFQFNVSPLAQYRVTFDLDGSPVRAGLTLKTLTGV